MTTRTWRRANADFPNTWDRFYLVTRRVKAGTKVTMYEVNRSDLGGPRPKTVVVWPTSESADTFIAMLDAIDAIGADLKTDGWEYEIPEPRRRKRA